MKKNSLFRAISCLLVVAVLFGCSFAYFSDYATEQAIGTAGTVALSMDSDINLLDPDGQDIINPGDMRDGSFTVTNEGNKSIDVRTTIALTTQSNTGFDLAFSGDGTTQSEYDLYLRDDVELVEGKGWMPKDGAQPLQVKSIDQDVITYILPEYSLNGNSDRYDEVETVDGVTEFAHTYDFVMVMKGGATNEWQNSSVSIDVLVEAKQHENTNAGWEIVAKENVTSGSINQSAVKGESVISGVNGEISNTGKVSFSLKDADTGAGIAGIAMNLIDNATGAVIDTAIADANGYGEFTGLAAGDYKLTSAILSLNADADSLVLSTNHDAAHYEHSESISAWAGGIEGNLKNEEGEAIVGVQVEIKNENGEVVAGTKTDNNGDFSVYPIPEGEYTVEADGYDPVDKEAVPTVSVQAGSTESVEIKVIPARTVFESNTFLNNKFKQIQTDKGVELTEIQFLETPAPGYVSNEYVLSHGGLSTGEAQIRGWVEGTTLYIASTDGGVMYFQDSMVGLFSGLTSLQVVNFGTADTSIVTNMEEMFNGCAALTTVEFGDVFTTTNVTDMDKMFYGCVNLENINAEKLRVDSVTTMVNMFAECSSIKSLNLSAWNVEKLTSTYGMFLNCSSLEEIDLSNWNPVSLRSRLYMFEGCTNLKTIYAGDWTSVLPAYTDWSGNMFGGCTSLVGAVAYNSAKIDGEMANPTTGYFTSK